MLSHLASTIITFSLHLNHTSGEAPLTRRGDRVTLLKETIPAIASYHLYYPQNQQTKLKKLFSKGYHVNLVKANKVIKMWMK